MSLVNRSPDHEVTVPLLLVNGAATGTADVSVVTGPSPDTLNSGSSPDAISVMERTLDLHGSDLRVTLPACSVNVLRIPLG